MKFTVPIPATTGEYEITPGMARAWLKERNQRNRSLRPAYAKQMARDMASGAWTFNGETFKFDRAGNLIDGQHRLAALVESGTTQRALVVVGLSPEAMETIDTGAKRTVSDVITMGGEWEGVPSAILAATARIGVRMDRGTFTNKSEIPTTSEMLTWIENNSEIAQHAKYAGANSRAFNSQPALTAYAMMRTARLDVFQSAQFFDKWLHLNDLTMAADGPGDPVAAMVRRFNSASANKERLPQPTRLWAIFRAWNAVRAKEELTRMILPGQNVKIPEPK